MEIYDAFTNEKFVAKVISFLSLEEKKGKDSFSGNKFHLFHVSFTDVLLLVYSKCFHQY